VYDRFSLTGFFSNHVFPAGFVSTENIDPINSFWSWSSFEYFPESAALLCDLTSMFPTFQKSSICCSYTIYLLGHRPSPCVVAAQPHNPCHNSCAKKIISLGKSDYYAIHARDCDSLGAGCRPAWLYPVNDEAGGGRLAWRCVGF